MNVKLTETATAAVKAPNSKEQMIKDVDMVLVVEVTVQTR